MVKKKSIFDLTPSGAIRRAATGDGRKDMDYELRKQFPENKKKKSLF